ncbi:pre-mRNA processing factor 3-domain-containing protein [Phakopsora pachyrhizi]|uniref:Pre-mRNA processing factor 3-domain-containing protein n=1 Tax=Phakopsora pachyrhizi TaxID=170000 RepID=A0AAV0AHM5_PHAPC|nr:pre-mRNA processing factor 3-domain-containing protein [Phakopsora pachyrhizi]
MSSSSSKKRSVTEDNSSPASSKRAKGYTTLSFLPPKGDLTNILSHTQTTQTLPSKATPLASSEAIARKRAEIAAKFASFKTLSGNVSSSTPSTVNQQVASASTSLPNIDPNLARKVAEARKTVEQLTAKAKNPYLSGPSDPVEPATMSNTGVHPLLIGLDKTQTGGTSLSDRYKPMVPKFATVKANVAKPAPSALKPKKTDLYQAVQLESDPAALDNRNNPHFDKSLAGPIGDPSGVIRTRATRSLRFNPKGKFIRLAEQVRAEARLEELKRRIAESSRKAGLDGEIEAVEKQVRRPVPPDCEWWDEDYLPNRSYNDLDDATASKFIYSTESPISIYVQHPIQLTAPGDKDAVALKPLKLTKNEQRKMRRQRRMAELQDKQDRQRMGLLPPDPPKVKLSNMMKVLTSDAVADPTKIEARVRREMLQRKKTHEQANESRKLTDEQRKEKQQKKREADESRGIFTTAYKIRYLTNPAHRFKVRKNAEQYGLTGVLIFNPRFALVVAEGGSKATRAYKHLMLERIDWTAEARPRTPEEDRGDQQHPQADGEEPAAEPQSLADNKCELIWEGEGRERVFNTFRPKNCPSDAIAREFLGPRLGFWDVAKKWGEDTVS